MAISTEYGSVVVDTSLVPYIRERDVDFVARNLKPYKTSTLFFDEVAVNGYAQRGSKLVVDAKKIIVISSNNTGTISANDIVYQGTSNTVNTFSAVIDAWYTANSTVVLKTILGNFDDVAQLYIQGVTGANTGITYANCNVGSVTNFQTSDIFDMDEGVIDPGASNAYARVIATSGENILYIDHNYININVEAVGVNTLSTMSSDYKVGDIVYQTTDGTPGFDDTKIVFKGYVAYYNTNGSGTIAISPLNGSIVANSNIATSNAKVRFWNASNTSSKPLAANSFNKYHFSSSAGHNVQSATDSTKSIKVTSYSHSSGVFANTNTPNNLTVILNTNSGAEAGANGNLIYFTTGTGVGAIRRVVAISGDIAVLNSAINFSVTSNTHYSIGNFVVDDAGTVAGIFHIPSNQTVKFKTGERLFTITDTDTYNDPNYGMRATHRYSASAILNTKQRIQMTPIVAPMPETEADSAVAPINPADRTFNSDTSKSPVTGSTTSSIPRIPLGDGLSQTFFTPKPSLNKQDYGIFVSSIDLFFKKKPSIASGSMQLPISVKIAEVSNGYPTKNYLASKTIQCKDVKISSLPSTSNSATVTKFTFDDPVYLQPNQEYAIIIGSDSPDYSVYTAVIGEDVLGSNPTRRISEQPYAGSLFRSQNSSTWTPYQNEDLMFVINKAVFASSGTAVFNMEDAPIGMGFIDKALLISSDLAFPAANLNYQIKGIYSADVSYDSGNYITPHKTLEYGSLFDKSNKTGQNKNRRIIRPGNANSVIVTVDMYTSDSDISPILNTERLAVKAIKYDINNAGLSNDIISVISTGAGYNAVATSGNVVFGSSNTTINARAQLFRTQFLANNYNVGFYNITITNNPNDSGSGAYGFAVANTDGSNTLNYIVLTNAGSGYLETPTITITTGNATSNTQATALIAGETDKSGGNILSKYITREIILEDGFESGDISVFMDAIRVTNSDIQVYYKIVSIDDPDALGDKSWRRMQKVKDIYSKDYNTKITLQFKPDLNKNQISYTENGVNYPIGGSFKSFAIKICLLSSDGAVVPKLDNLRITATPSG
jgi:hypothetical protein